MQPIPLYCLQVASKLGVKSLQGQTLAESADYMQLGVASVKAFGQCTRLWAVHSELCSL